MGEKTWDAVNSDDIVIFLLRFLTLLPAGVRGDAARGHSFAACRRGRVKEKIEDVGEAAKNASKKVGDKIKDTADVAAQKTAENAKKAGEALKNAGQHLKDRSGA